MTNPILKELYDIRAQILAEHGDDLEAYLHDVLEQAKAAGHPVANIKQRRVRRTGRAAEGEGLTDAEEQAGPRRVFPGRATPSARR